MTSRIVTSDQSWALSPPPLAELDEAWPLGMMRGLLEEL